MLNGRIDISVVIYSLSETMDHDPTVFLDLSPASSDRNMRTTCYEVIRLLTKVEILTAGRRYMYTVAPDPLMPWVP